MNQIKLRVQSEEWLYQTLDPEEACFTDEIRSYIYGKMVRQIKQKDHEIIVQSPEQLNEEKFLSAVRQWIRDDKESMRTERKKDMVMQTYFGLLGIGFLLLEIILEGKASIVWQTVISAVSGFSLWEVVNIWIFQFPVLRLRKKVLEKITKKTKIRFERV